MSAGQRILTALKRLTLQDWVHIATLVGVGIGAWSLRLTALESRDQSKQFAEQQRLQREFTAYETWEKFFEFSMQYPDLSSAKEGVAMINGVPSEQYVWFVERILIAGEQVLRAEPNDVQWRQSIAWEIRSHPGYILSDEFLGTEPGLISSYCTYETGLRQLIRSAFSDSKAVNLLQDAEAKCKSELDRLGSPNA